MSMPNPDEKKLPYWALKRLNRLRLNDSARALWVARFLENHAPTRGSAVTGDIGDIGGKLRRDRNRIRALSLNAQNAEVLSASTRR